MTSDVLALIATGRYREFLPDLLASVDRYFLHDRPALDVVCFTDAPAAAPRAGWRRLNLIALTIPHEPWPGPTLHRYRHLASLQGLLDPAGRVFYLDVDMRCEAPIASRELGGDGLLAVEHPGYRGLCGSALPLERRAASRAGVPAGEGRRYYAGGFQGGGTRAYLRAALALRDAIAADEAEGVVAAWHDESHWNRWLHEFPPATTLPYQFCAPQSWRVADRRIVALDKNHAAYRSAPSCAS